MLKYKYCFKILILFSLNIYPKMGLLDHMVVLFFLIFIFDWRIIVLQYCVGFCHTTIIRYKYTYIPFLGSLPPRPSSHSSRSSQSTRLSSLCYTAASYLLSVLNVAMYVSVLISYPTFSFPDYVHKSILYIFVLIPALQIVSSVPFF